MAFGSLMAKPTTHGPGSAFMTTASNVSDIWPLLLKCWRHAEAAQRPGWRCPWGDTRDPVAAGACGVVARTPSYTKNGGYAVRMMQWEA